ncbi:UNVERIFIED_ORG: NADPH:quinone reductase-like Zn-dependent oxidoreductase [Methylobacterium sp. SuP10 SLI 274]|uniref:zinc-dependent alcohol dehydrogenase family protein n=1 Tax=Methylorubrum extorquens TaxID=408 RepID=UPI00209CC084|nr:NAD(P)-dependent alcohol dehydrogenase [Methylorubrum extorquens]MDF9864610.1 NADPH:quinone reductase-like Zn-dependent oxidoreductase [Methylorubrum pseudosasae]MDH6638195.1 NADPH:quinone reductase-like Zn-dependent oxidoreductase [Methylobacterium sp. SuP10 SLI 274]MDH6667376.1 NADPH:quinone reductase-like Zn-dependent oxidoreductase [Methylorubrum zatmanii]MCP1559278.1 NADPH:quinone reductase-like Zn-dependent oxidoreductase [Methylorubrum extorquens]MDF9792922.1 NADPH:quinone reductase-
MRAYEMSAAAGLDSWKSAERPTPEPGRGQVLVRMRAASLNYRDLLICQGHYPFAVNLDRLIPLSDGAGEIVAIGEGVRRFTGGERVAGIFSQSWLGGAQVADTWQTALGGAIDGVLTEYQVFDEDGLVTLPDHLSFEEGATLPCAAVTAWNALYGLKPLRAGETVLTLGTGGVSIFAIQLAHAAGARVIATSSSDAKLEKARALGAHDTINYRTHPDWEGEVRRLTGGTGVDHVVEVGGTGTLPRSIASTRPGGHIGLIGLLAQGEAFDPLAILGASCIVRGVAVGPREMFEDMNRSIALHGIKPVIDRVYGFDEAPAALKALAEAGHVGKIVIRID